jgi:hypothetical protein
MQREHKNAAVGPRLSRAGDLRRPVDWSGAWELLYWIKGGAIMTYREALPALQVWEEKRSLVRIEKHSQVFNGILTEVSKDTGKLELRTGVPEEGKRTPMVFEFTAVDDFQEIAASELGKDWDEGFMVFLRSGDWLTLRKWKR